MTFEEKREAIKTYCQRKPLCTVAQKLPCPLYALEGACYEDDTLVERNFKIISEMPDYRGKKEDAKVCSSDKAMEVEKVLNEMVNHPNHYNQGGMECIDEMLLIFGKEAIMNFCLCNAWKYRYRANAKNGQEDMDKANWYIAKYKELKEEA